MGWVLCLFEVSVRGGRVLFIFRVVVRVFFFFSFVGGVRYGRRYLEVFDSFFISICLFCIFFCF